MNRPERGGKIGRNDPCPCGSGKKFKKCCLAKEPSMTPRIHPQKPKIRLKTPVDVAGIRRAGDLVLATLDMVEARIAPGITTEAINDWVHQFTVEHAGTPAPLNYRGFPKSTCVSVNEEICHGIPGPRRLRDGDIVNVDVTTILNGYYADANKTFFVGTPGDDARKIVAVARQSLKEGIAMVRPGNCVGDIGWVIQTYAEGQGCSVVRDFVGHGVGFDFHEPPQIPHYGQRGDGIRLVPGMVFTIEPMINLGGYELLVLEDQWTAVTKDRSLSAQFEQTLLVTENGCESLTPFPL
ncbi:type I methionyl aminopeptidase [Desulfatitalea sp. M08but]|uniref:Methionine aminopeptidase n=1 Tax=Desulfatitalea alkaliphila TaxID=2929485 RepID=A0AA41QZF7_9BACT|nr:type I methionyl aminopeptidase [Desulfatitalea alkaliphila]MCJ8499074.1 type I methionyl aminopeptidase [Desulfatitalea alkaliphila]